MTTKQNPMQAFNALSHIVLKSLAFGALALATACGPGGLGGGKAGEGDYSLVRSLTGAGFTGQKYYLGWGEILDGFMGNETYYDVKHTHDIFANQVGGKYKATKLDRDSGSVSGSSISSAMSTIKGQIKPTDMYVQYSSGHGYPSGLGVGVTYDQIRDNALSYGAKETVVFIMACHSGGLVNSFKNKSSELERMKQEGKTLFVMSSSTVQETSSTGPMTDSDESAGRQGSAGSAYGHALWKALIGYADGAMDGVKDGFIDMSEIEAYTKKRTQEIGGHSPVAYGFNYQWLVMNEVPNGGYEAGLDGGTSGLSDAEIAASVAELDQALATD
jgi:hypothetical protein